MKDNKLISAAGKQAAGIPVIGLLPVAFFIFMIGDFLGGNASIFIQDNIHFLQDKGTYLSLMSVCLVAIFVFLVVKFIESRPISTIGLEKKSFLSDSFKGFVTGLVLFGLVFIIAYFLGAIKFDSINLNPDNIFASLVIIPFWMIQAGSEEILTRGWLLPALSSKIGVKLGILLSSLLFTLMHYENSGINMIALFNITIVAVFLAILTLKAESLWYAIGFHTAWNYMQGTILGLSVSGGAPMVPRLMTNYASGNKLITGGSFGLEGSLIVSCILVLACVLIYFKPQIYGIKQRVYK